MNNYFNYFWDLLIIAPALVGIATSKATETNYNVIIGKISFLNIWTLFITLFNYGEKTFVAWKISMISLKNFSRFSDLKFPKAQTFAKMTKKRES